jgi:tetratricopeptide (TPR) repeat protein
MSEKPDNPTTFWQELKRRKVVRVIAMYAAAAYVIIELCNNVAQPLNLPEWTPTLIIVLLAIGFPFAVIFSWIFDVTPEGIKKTEPVKVAGQIDTVAKPAKRKIRVSDMIIAGLVVIVVILVYPKVFRKDRMDQMKGADGKLTLAVMPFQNMTNDTLWDVWGLGIQNELIVYLSNSPSLSVRQLESVSRIMQLKDDFQYTALTPSVASSISQKLNAYIFIYGNIIEAGERIRLNTQLMDAETEEIFQSFQLECKSEAELLDVVDSLSLMVSNFLEVSSIDKDLTHVKTVSSTTKSPQAYRYWVHGWNAFVKSDFPRACEWFLQSQDIDSNYFGAILMLSLAYANQGMYEEGKKWCMKIQDLKDHLPLSIKQELLAKWTYSSYFETPREEIKWIRQAIELDDQAATAYFVLGLNYIYLDQYHNAIPALEKALEIWHNWDTKPMFVYNYTNLGYAYHQTGQYKKEKQLYRKASMDYPDDPAILYRQAVLALTEGDSAVAEGLIQDHMTIRRDVYRWSDDRIHSALGRLFSEAEYFVRAEKEFRKALTLAPENASVLNSLAWMLIDHDIDLNEGLKLIDRALEIDSADYSCLDTKGWGLYKQEKYDEALKILQKAWDLRPIYDHDVYMHIQEAEKAIASQNQ